MQKLPITELNFKLPTSTKVSGISSSLYDVRTTSNRENNDKEQLNVMLEKLSRYNPHLPMVNIVNLEAPQKIKTSFGMMPVGSVLRNQCSLMPPDFQVYSTLTKPKHCSSNFVSYPPFPFNPTKDMIHD